jgi:hypothetical protein
MGFKSFPVSAGAFCIGHGFIVDEWSAYLAFRCRVFFAGLIGSDGAAAFPSAALSLASRAGGARFRGRWPSRCSDESRYPGRPAGAS